MKHSPYSAFSKMFRLHTVKNDKYIWDCSCNPKEPGALILCKRNKGDNQKFYMTPTNNGKWRIHCMDNGKALAPDSEKEGLVHFVTETNSFEQ